MHFIVNYSIPSPTVSPPKHRNCSASDLSFGSLQCRTSVIVRHPETQNLGTARIYKSP